MVARSSRGDRTPVDDDVARARNQHKHIIVVATLLDEPGLNRKVDEMASTHERLGKVIIALNQLRSQQCSV